MKFIVGDKVRIKSKKKLLKMYSRDSSLLSKAKLIDEIDKIIPTSAAKTKSGDTWFREALQLILESPKLKLRLSQNGLKLNIKILEQDESLRGKLRIEHGAYWLRSEGYPNLYYGEKLYIIGINILHDNNKISYTYNSQEELDNFVEALRIMMKDERLQ